MKGKYLQFCLGVVAGGLLFSTTAAAADYLTARPTTQTFYLSGQSIQFEAYEIHGNNFVKLRDIGQAVDFGVTYDAATNSVHIDPNAHYEQEVTAPAQTTPTPSNLTEETVQSAFKKCLPNRNRISGPVHFCQQCPIRGQQYVLRWLGRPVQ